MSKITGDGMFFDIVQSVQYSNGTHPTIDTSVFPGNKLLSMDEKIESLIVTVGKLQCDAALQKDLIAKYPTVKDAYEQYLIAVKLVQE